MGKGGWRVISTRNGIGWIVSLCRGWGVWLDDSGAAELLVNKSEWEREAPGH